MEMTDAEIIYRNFCENEIGNEPLDKAWFEYETCMHDIESNSPTEKLIIAAMQYALDHRLDDAE